MAVSQELQGAVDRVIDTASFLYANYCAKMVAHSVYRVHYTVIAVLTTIFMLIAQARLERGNRRVSALPRNTFSHPGAENLGRSSSQNDNSFQMIGFTQITKNFAINLILIVTRFSSTIAVSLLISIRLQDEGMVDYSLMIEQFIVIAFLLGGYYTFLAIHSASEEREKNG